MKRWIAFFLTMSLLFIFSACANNNQSGMRSYSTNDQNDVVPNPNMITGRSTDVHNLGTVTRSMAAVARQVPGVQKAFVYTNGPTAYIRLTLDKSVNSAAQLEQIKNQVYKDRKSVV